MFKFVATSLLLLAVRAEDMNMTDDMVIAPPPGNGTDGDPFYCELCPGGGIKFPEAVLVVPTQEDSTCGEYEDWNLAGLFNASTCPMIQQITVNVCCSDLAEEPAPAPTPSSAFDYGTHLAVIGTIGMLGSVFFL